MKSKLRVFLFIGSLFFFLSAFMFSDENNALLDIEKREAASLPTIKTHTINGLPAGWDEYISDHFPFRHTLIKFAGELSYDLFGAVRNDAVVIGENHWLFLRNMDLTSPMQDYQGTNLFNEQQLEEIKTAAENLYNASVQKDIQVVVAVVPNKETVYSRYLPDSYPKVNDFTRKQQVCDYIARNSNLNVINLTDVLVKAAEEDDSIYFIADSHWNGRGAYIGAYTMLESLGIKCIPFEKAEFYNCGSYESDIANLCGLPDKYDYVHDWHAKEIITFEQQQKSAVVIGDSFRFEAGKYFQNAFTDCTVVDGSYNNILKSLENDVDILAVITVERNLNGLATLLNDCATGILQQ